MNTYIALLRGINVGGNNIIKMVDLRQFFKDIGCRDVQSYIQSGNVIFRSDEPNRDNLTNFIQPALRETFNYNNPLVLIHLTELLQVVSEAPPGFGKDNENFKYEVLYLLPPLKASDILNEIPVREDVDRAWKGPGVIYYRRSSEHLTHSMLNKLPSKPVYQKMTIRNWRTSNKILELAGPTPENSRK